VVVRGRGRGERRGWGEKAGRRGESRHRGVKEGFLVLRYLTVWAFSGRVVTWSREWIARGRLEY